MLQVSGAKIYEKHPRWQVEGAENWKRLLVDSKDEAVSEKGFARKIVRIGGEFLVPEAAM